MQTTRLGVALQHLLGLAAVGALCVGGSANAALVHHNANFSLVIAMQNIGTVTVPGTGSVTVDTVTGAVSVPAAAVSLASTINFPVTTSSSVVSVIAKAGIDNLAGSFFAGNVEANTAAEICPAGLTPRACIVGGGRNGPMALSGTVSVRLPGNAVLPIPLGAGMIGVGGTTQIPPNTGFFFENGVWTSGQARIAFISSVSVTVLVGGLSVMTPITTPQTLVSSGTASGQLTSASALITLVTPSYVVALGNQLPTFSSFTIHIVPEAGTLLQLGSAIAGLALYGCYRRRDR